MNTFVGTLPLQPYNYQTYNKKGPQIFVKKGNQISLLLHPTVLPDKLKLFYEK